MGFSTRDRVYVRDQDLVRDLLGRVGLGGVAFLELTGRLPSAKESRMFDALAVTLVEHGVTPSALAARLTYLGAPESLQGAVAAGILGVGSRLVGSMEDAARMLQDALPLAGDHTASLPEVAEEITRRHLNDGRPIPGIGHPVHKPIDPRAGRLFEIAEEEGFAGRYVRLIQLTATAAERATGKTLPVNATGAIAAIASELGFPWRVCRGLGVIARAIGLVGHILEELHDPIAHEIWRRADDESSAASREDAERTGDSGRSAT